MGQFKLRPDAAKARGRYPAVVLGDPKPIAQRFAHSADLRQAALRRDDPPRTSQPGQPPAAARGATASAEGRLAVWTHLPIAGLILAALIPSLILAAFWLGLLGMPGSKPAVAVPAPQTAAPSAVLTAPERLEAIAGEDVSFPIALDGTDGVPSRSVIAIRGLPQGSNFSEGRPFGDSEWNLKPDQIGDLALVLPTGASGHFKLAIALIGPDDRVIAGAETLLEVTPAPADQVAVEESSAASPDGNEAATPTPNPVPDGSVTAAPAPVPDGSEVAALAPVPEEGRGDGADSEEKPTTMDAAGPSGDTPPNTVGQSEDGENGLGTVEPSVFVNMREGPSSSVPVLGVVAKGTKLAVLDRKRGWVQVIDPATGKKGWIYSGLLAGEAKTHHRIRRAAPPEPEPKSESFWGRMGRWLSP